MAFFQRGLIRSARTIGDNIRRPFSTTISDNIMRIIESDYAAQQSLNNIHVPDDFPFEMIEDYNKSGLYLTRKYQDETIEVHVDPYFYKIMSEPSFRMNAYISRGTQKLKFYMTVKPDRMYINECVARDVHRGVYKSSLEIRGFNSTNINFLGDCFRKPILKQVSKCFPDRSPFTIEDGAYKTILEREFENEKIKAAVSLPNEDETLSIQQQSLNSENENVQMDFEIIAFPHHHHFMRIRKITTSFGSYSMPWSHLKAFEIFWEARGLKSSITNFLLDYLGKYAFAERHQDFTWMEN